MSGDPMEWTIAFWPMERVLFVATSGVLDVKSSLGMTRDVVAAVAQYGTQRCLVDFTALSGTQGGPLEIYFHADEVKQAGVTAQFKIAEVMPPAGRENFLFLETVFRNRGLNIVMFDDRAAALAWLQA